MALESVDDPSGTRHSWHRRRRGGDDVDEVLSRVDELLALARWIRTQEPAPSPHGFDELYADAENRIRAAHQAVTNSRANLQRLLGFRASARDVELATVNLDAAEATLLRIAPPAYLRAQLPDILTRVQQLPIGSAYRVNVERLAVNDDLTLANREMVAEASRAVSEHTSSMRAQHRAFRRLIATVTLGMTGTAITISIVGALWPDAISLCFAADGQSVCPTGSAPLEAGGETAASSSLDVLLVEVFGMGAASVAAAAGLRFARGSAIRDTVWVWLAVLKLPAGALTALLGLLLLKGGFVPGFDSLDTTAQIVAWAIVFGYSQQLFTRLTDTQALLHVESERRASTAPGSATEASSSLQTAVLATLNVAAAAPRLLNYRGVLSVHLTNSLGVALQPNVDGQYGVAAGQQHVVVVQLGPHPIGSGTHVKISISDGDLAESVSFRVALAASGPGRMPEARDLSVVENLPSEAVRLPFMVESTRSESNLWVRLSQRGSLVQVVSFNLVTSLIDQ